jgi:NDP-sugar pyrophosphorylase family protein
VVHRGPFVDCGTPADYLRANLLASGGRSVIDERAEVGTGATVVRSVVWDRSSVAPGERLVDAVRAEDVTVLVR